MSAVTYQFTNAFDANIVTDPAHVSIVSARVSQMINTTRFVKAKRYITRIIYDGVTITIILDIVK